MFLLCVSQHSIKDPLSASQFCSAEPDNQSPFQQALAHSFELQLLMALQGSLEASNYFWHIFKSRPRSNQQGGFHPASLCREHPLSLSGEPQGSRAQEFQCVPTITWLLLTPSTPPAISLCTHKRAIFRDSWMTGIEAINDLNNAGCTALKPL